MQLNYECDTTLFNWSSSSWKSTSIGSIGIECSNPPPDCDMSCRIAHLRAYQQAALSESRLGIPVTFVIETSHCGAAGGTIFEMGAAMGASWNTSLVQEIFQAIAVEARSWGGSRGLSPEISVVTDVRFGRTEENFGEEPMLVARMAAAATLGLQGVGMPTEYLESFENNIIAEAKHCCVYGFSGLDGGAADVSEKTLRDIYFKPWRAAVRAGLRGYMASHNDLNGVPMHANADVHMELFRREWDYKGFVHSDWGNIRFLSNTHLSLNDTGSAKLALEGGIDQAFCDSPYYPGVLEPAVAAGTINISDVDRATYNILAAKFAAGLFDGALPDPTRRNLINSDAHRELARRSARQSVVLLENSGILPLKIASGYKIAVIGPNAGCPNTAGANPWTCLAMRGQLGGYSNLEQTSDALLDNAAHVVTVLEAAVAAANASSGSFSVSFAQGVHQSGFDDSGIASAASLANASDVVIAVLGDGGESVGYDSSVSCGEGADRPSLDLPGVQLDLLEALLDTGKPVVVVVMHGRPFTFGSDYGGSRVSRFQGAPLNKRAAAVLAAWRPGCEGGSAIWDLLTGIESPSGRLAQSFPRSAGASRIPGLSPAYIKFTDQGGQAWTLGQPFTPLYPLGYGLDYLQITLRNVSAVVDAANQVIDVTVNVANAASREGAFVVQIYFSQVLSRYSRYQKILGGFTKVLLPALGAIDIPVSLSYADLAYWDPKAKTMTIEAGNYTLFACQDISTCSDATLTVTVPVSVTGL
jgi:beta-glucosidase